MRVLFTSSHTTGSWVMRGEQMADQNAEWRAVLQAGTDDLKNIDAVVVVKYASRQTREALKAWGGPVVFDPQNFWRDDKLSQRTVVQTVTNADAARELFELYRTRIEPHLVICTNQTMADDLSPLCKVAVLHHHFDPRLETPNPNSLPSRKRVLYHGRKQYIAEWLSTFRSVCDMLKLEFVIHERDLLPPPAHMMVAVRGLEYDSWLAQRWKSNVKSATAARLGMHFVAWPENSYLETHPEGFWFRNMQELYNALQKSLSTPLPKPELHRFSAAWAADELTRILKQNF